MKIVNFWEIKPHFEHSRKINNLVCKTYADDEKILNEEAGQRG